MSPHRCPRVYVAHPQTAYGTTYGADQIAALAKALPHAELVDPEAARWATNADWLRDWPVILGSLSGLVVFADRAGTIGTGCLRELVDAVMVGLALAAWEPGVGLVELVGIELVEVESRSPRRAAFLDYGAPLPAKAFPREVT